MSKKEARKFAKTKHEGLPVHKEECGMDEKPKLKKKDGAVDDVREIPTKMNLVKNKFRAMGLKMNYEPEGNTILEYERGDEPGEPGSSIRRGTGGRYQSDSVREMERRIRRGDLFKDLQAPLKPVRGAQKPEKGTNKTA
jgi:hypothetical protein